MTFNPSVPNAAQSPGLFPPQNNTNFTRLKNIINADHVFNDTEPFPNNDGVHRQVTILNRAPPAGAIASGAAGIMYAAANAMGNSELAYYNTYAHYPVLAVKAFVNFTAIPASPSVPTIRGSYNVASVTRNSTVGSFRITFIKPFVSVGNGATYTTQITCMGFPITVIVIGNIKGSANLSTVQTDAWVDIETRDINTGSRVDPVYVGVTITSYI